MSTGRRRWPRLLGAPEQGWSSLLLMLGLLLLLGLSIADGRPLVLVPGQTPPTDALPVLMLAGGLIGYLLARSSLGVVRAHVLGATAAAMLLLLVAGGSLLGEAATPLASWAAVTERIEAVWGRLDSDVAAIVDYLAEDEPGGGLAPTVATFLVFGAVCWTTAQFSAFSVFRYDRGGPAVMAIGTVLFLNVGLESLVADAERLPVVPVLAIFAALAMLLLMRLQLMQQRLQWARRHISDTGEVSRLFLRTGLVFVLLTVLGASSLTTWATVDAQELDVGGLEDALDDLGEELARWLPVVAGPAPREARTTRDDDWTVEERWDEDRATGTAFEARLEGQLRGNYWWGWADDQFDGFRWSTSQKSGLDLLPSEPLPVAPEASSGGRDPVRATITLGDTGYVGGMVFRPAEARVIDRAVTAYRIDDGGGIGDVTYSQPLRSGDEVVVDSLVRDYGSGGTSPTANELRAAGDFYPLWTDRYLQGAGDASINGDRVRAEAARIAARKDNAYDAAVLLQDRLRSWEYETEMGSICASYQSIPECVLDVKQGFCQHYATTMTMVLRELGIPARVVTGYLPGERANGVVTVPQRAFHNWVEAYFPGYGWIRFDPTPGERGLGQERTGFEDGPEIGPGETLPPDVDFSPEPDGSFEPDPTASPIPGAGPTGGSGDLDTGILVISISGLVALALALASVLLLFRLRRMPGADGGLAYSGIVSLATRLGYGPHPSQTEYEYAEALSEAIPSVRDDLHLVADARVETRYGRRHLDPQHIGALRRAYARIRTALLRLSLRLTRRPEQRD